MPHSPSISGLLLFSVLVLGCLVFAIWGGAERARTEASELAAQARRRERAAIDALIARRWLRNALELEGPSPHKSCTSGAAIALALVGREQLVAHVRRVSPASREELLARGCAEADPVFQVAQQWDLILRELEGLVRMTHEQAIAELLYGEREGEGYWNLTALELSAAECLTRAHFAAFEIARERSGVAGLSNAQEGTRSGTPVRH